MNPLSSVGTGELIFILIIALIFLGPERLPEIARSVGKTIRQFRDALQNVSSEFGQELASMQKVSQDIQEGIQAAQDVRNLPKTLINSATAPLMEATNPLKDTAQEIRRAVETIAPPVEPKEPDSATDETANEAQTTSEDDKA